MVIRIVAVALLLAVGCTSTPPLYSCDYPSSASPSQEICYDYLAGYSESAASEECHGFGTGQVFSTTTACSTIGRLGRCRATEIGVTNPRTYQYAWYGGSLSAFMSTCVSTSSEMREFLAN